MAIKRSARGRKLDKLNEAGYQAARAGKPIDTPETVTRELERAAWENGWRAGKSDLDGEARFRERLEWIAAIKGTK
jgi:ribosome modulation factor